MLCCVFDVAIELIYLLLILYLQQANIVEEAMTVASRSNEVKSGDQVLYYASAVSGCALCLSFRWRY